MKALKTIFAIVFSFTLIATQVVFGDATERFEKKCEDCCCAQMKCCNRAAPAPVQPQPSQTTRTTQTQLQFVAAYIFLLPKPALKPSAKQAEAFSSHHSTGVPLFARNCSFLI